jgi:hypothetical protein
VGDAAPGSSDPEAQLAVLGAALAAAVAAAVPGWVLRCVEGLLPAAAADRVVVLARAEEAGRRAGDDVGAALGSLLARDIDDQRTTPLEVVRGAVSYPTAVLRAAGVEPVQRDRFTRERFPEDSYGLSPASLGAVSPELAEPGLAWGAAKAFVHRRRHAGPPPSPGGAS